MQGKPRLACVAIFTWITQNYVRKRLAGEALFLENSETKSVVFFPSSSGARNALTIKCRFRFWQILNERQIIATSNNALTMPV